MSLTVGQLIEQLRRLPDPTAPVAIYVDGTEYRITAAAPSTMRVHSIDAVVEPAGEQAE